MAIVTHDHTSYGSREGKDPLAIEYVRGWNQLTSRRGYVGRGYDGMNAIARRIGLVFRAIADMNIPRFEWSGWVVLLSALHRT